jgi:predicted nucleic acid-binding protein
MNFIVADASLWVARLVPQDAFYAPVRNWMDTRRAEKIEFLAPALLLAEVAGAIARRTGEVNLASRALEYLEHLPGLRMVEMDHALLDEAAHLAAELGLRGADSTYVAVAHRLSIPLATLDSDQRERAAKRVAIQPIE